MFQSRMGFGGPPRTGAHSYPVRGRKRGPIARAIPRGILPSAPIKPTSVVCNAHRHRPTPPPGPGRAGRTDLSLRRGLASTSPSPRRASPASASPRTRGRACTTDPWARGGVTSLSSCARPCQVVHVPVKLCTSLSRSSCLKAWQRARHEGPVSTARRGARREAPGARRQLQRPGEARHQSRRTSCIEPHAKLGG